MPDGRKTKQRSKKKTVRQTHKNKRKTLQEHLYTKKKTYFAKLFR